ncbi:hypothetical protein ACYUMR_000076 [Providencia stuartii]|uniref:hypothetical protein n=1 Tax=Providencia stuartii TaxID=588 RepID=UPI003AF320BE
MTFAKTYNGPLQKGYDKKWRKIMRFLNELKEIIFITLISSNAFASNQMFFHCITKDGVISMYSIDDELILTMKKNDSIVINYSSSLSKNSNFKYSYYSRFNTEYYRVTYSSGDANYSLYKNIEGGNNDSGLQVTHLTNNKEYQYECIKTQTDKLDKLLNILECDKGNALGCID